jgi:hypothetical protein
MANTAFNYVGGAYRTSARFGDRIELSMEGQNITVSGPRVGKTTYMLWISALTVMMASIPVLLIVSLITLDWAYIAITAGIFICHYLVAAGGAGALWSLASFTGAVSGKYPSASFPLSSVKNVAIGREWGRGGLKWIIPQFAPLIDRASERHCLSFEAPDGQTDKTAVYTIYLPREEDARSLMDLLNKKAD